MKHLIVIASILTASLMAQASSRLACTLFVDGAQISREKTAKKLTLEVDGVVCKAQVKKDELTVSLQSGITKVESTRAQELVLENDDSQCSCQVVR